MAGRLKVIDLAKELGVTSKDLLLALDSMGHKGKRAMTPLDVVTANELRTKLGRGRELAPEAKPKRVPKPKAAPVEGEAPAEQQAKPARKIAAKGAPGKAPKVEPEPLPVVELVKPAATLFRPAPAAPVPAEPAAVSPAPPVPMPPVIEPPKVEPPRIEPSRVEPIRPAPVTPVRPAAAPPAPPAPPMAPRRPGGVPGVPGVPTAPAAPGVTRPGAPPSSRGPMTAPPRIVPPSPPRPVVVPPARPVPPAVAAPAAVAPPAAAPSAPGETRPLPPPPEPPVEVKRELIKLPESVTVGELAAAMRRKSGEVIKALLELGVMATLNEVLDPTAAKLVADKFSFDVEVRSLEGDVLEEEETDPSQLRSRPPVVTVMGHVDHGKTSLLDAIRKTRVAEKEAGGITQHIGAYQVETSHGKVTFLDTPGHEAFTAMRARGAKATDIVILVVAADDGVMPQTVEAVNHAKAAEVPIIVAVNKIDKPGAEPDRVKRELSNHGLVPEDWGGQTIFVHTSAKRGDGIAQLLEMTALQSEILELRANPSRAARGVIVEGRLDRGRGPVATALIQSGTLKEGDAVVVGSQSGRVRAMFSDRGKKTQQAGPADPVEILGLSGVPQAGDTLLVVADERKARQIATVRADREKLKGKGSARITLEELHKQIESGEVKELRLILKADVQGSVEALTESLERLSTDEVKLKVIHGSVGAVNESDVMLASASNAIVLGFNVKADAKAASQAQSDGVDVRSYSVIYDVINDVRAALSGMLAPEIRETILGRAQVRQVFPISKLGLIFGSAVTEGKMVRGARVRVKRGETLLGEGTISSLKRFKDDVREVLQGLECGIGVDGVKGVATNDTIEAFTTEEVARTL
ncbi:MAG TPA: translation initiation factor IF-2 [Pseudomonadales bacterium]|nr:translation initiation factor IF-2 [Pseudomonadales bacterium]